MVKKSVLFVCCVFLSFLLRTQTFGQQIDNEMSLLSIQLSTEPLQRSKEVYDNVIGYYGRTIESYKASLRTDISEEQKAVHSFALARIYCDLHNYGKAVYYGEEALKYTEKTDKEFLAKIYNQLGTCYYELNDISSSTASFLQAISMYESIEDNAVSYCYARLYENYFNLGDMANADKYIRLLEKSIESYSEKESREYQIYLSTLGKYMMNINRFDRAVELFKEGLLIVQKIYGENSAELFPTLYSLYHVFHKKHDYQTASYYLDRCLSITKDNSFEIDEYIVAIVAKAYILFEQGMLGEAIALGESIYEKASSLSDENKTKWAYYEMLSYFYAETRDYETALRYGKLLLEYNQTAWGPNSPQTAPCLLNISSLYSVLGYKAEAMQAYSEALQIIKTAYGTDSREYYQALVKYPASDSQDAKELRKESVRVSMKLFGKESLEYSNALACYSWDLFHANKKDSAIQVLREAIKTRRIINKNDDLYSFAYYNWLSSMYGAINEYDSVYYTNKELFGNVKSFLKKNFTKLNVLQREVVWQELRQSGSSILSGVAIENRSNNNMKLIYDALLLGKTFLLQSSNTLSDAIKESSDSVIKTLQAELASEKRKLNTKLDANEQLFVRENMNSIRRKMLDRISNSEKLNEYLDVDWTDIENALQDGEAAIEFCSSPIQHGANYCAVVLKKQMAPVIIPIFHDSELEPYLCDNKVYDYSNPGLYKVVWGLLEHYALKDVKTVFFSPDGILHSIAIEAVVDKDGRRANEKWNLYRLSSTIELLNRNRVKDNSGNAVLYGGLNYEMKSGKDEENHQKSLVATRIRAVNADRDNICYLPDTHIEIQEIKDVMVKNGFSCALYEGFDGTERSVKGLDGSNVSLIHFATHGFYWEDSAKTADSRSHINDATATGATETKLMKSGLYMSNAKAGIDKHNSVDADNDGILTSLEISQIDLSSTDMVVLSACNSGLGDITGDGVFGLQRGFKLAGVNSILMTLWKVNDQATQLLMTEFYKQLFAGSTKIEALKKGQEHVRSIPRFSAPIYWAGFVLLDALN